MDLPDADLLVIGRFARLVGLSVGALRLCGRSYERGIGRHWRFEDVRQEVGIEPLVVDPWTHPPCVPGACTEVAA